MCRSRVRSYHSQGSSSTQGAGPERRGRRSHVTWPLPLPRSDSECQWPAEPRLGESKTQPGRWNCAHRYLGEVCCLLLVRADFIGRAPGRGPESTGHCSSCYRDGPAKTNIWSTIGVEAEARVSDWKFKVSKSPLLACLC